jgi:integrase/recombinase XerD
VAGEQLPLLTEPTDRAAAPQAQAGQPGVTTSSTLRRAVRAFNEHMLRVDLTENTRKSYLWDLSLLERYLDDEIRIGEIGTKDLQAFMHHLKHGRGVRCTPKSYARRLTTLKVFFGWLASAGILDHDPAAPLVHQPAASPLPSILYDEQVERALDAARALLADSEKPDPRPLLLVSLILQMGIKKSECLALQLDHFDLSDPKAPAVHIRYRNPRRHYKERKIALEPSFPGLLRRYVEAYQPQKMLFGCTGRNLEYVLHGVAKLAGLERISFEMLRWTCAVHDYRAGVHPERLRRKLGLSEMAWEETLAKIRALVANPL